VSSRRRITVALVGLIALVIIGWIVRQYTGSGAQLSPEILVPALLQRRALRDSRGSRRRRWDAMFPTKWAGRTRKESAVGEAELPCADVTAHQAVADAERRGAVAHLLDGSELVSKRTTLDGIAAALSFPEWAGRNLDALYDCLTDLSWLPEGEHVLVWSAHRALAEHDPKAYRGINAVLRDAAENALCGRAFTPVLTRD
jgi:RNAse (barnase) inhibitor barstar